MMRRGFSFIEAIVGGLIFVVLISALVLARSGARRNTELSMIYLSMLESVTLATNQIRSDLRQIIVLPGKPIDPFTVKISADRQAIRMRHVVRDTSGPSVVPVPGFAEYRLVPARRPGRFHLARKEFVGGDAASGAGSAPETVFRGFELSNATFLLAEDDEQDIHMLHMALEVVSDIPVPDWGPFREKGMLVTNAVALLRPEGVYEKPYFFAEALQGEYDVPPADVVPMPAQEPEPVGEPGTT